MYRSVLVVLAAAALVLGSIIPASAQLQNTFQLHYWGTGITFQFGATGPLTDSGSAWGGSYRGDLLTKPWSVSAHYDSMSFTPSNWTWNSGTLWDVNAHYRFGPDLNKYFGVFVGYGGVSITSTGAPGNSGNAAGFRIGAEFLSRQPNGWFFAGDASWGPSWSPSGFTGDPDIGAAGNTYDYRIAVGREFQNGVGVELGWRGFSWNLPTSTPSCPSPGCTWTFSGVILGVTIRR